MHPRWTASPTRSHCLECHVLFTPPPKAPLFVAFRTNSGAIRLSRRLANAAPRHSVLTRVHGRCGWNRGVLDSSFALDLIQFSVFSRSGGFGRTFRAQGTGLRGKQAAAVARLPTGTWLGVQSGTPQVLMGVDTPPGTKARDSLTVYAIDEEGNAHNAIARVPHGLWERLADPTSFNVRRDEAAGGAEIAGGGDRLFVAGIGDSLEVFEYRVGDDARDPPRSPVSPAGMPRQGVHQVFASREGSLWIGQHDPAAESSVFHVFEESPDGWSRTGTLTLQGNVRILDASRDRVLFVHRDSLGQETVVVGRGGPG